MHRSIARLGEIPAMAGRTLQALTLGHFKAIPTSLEKEIEELGRKGVLPGAMVEWRFILDAKTRPKHMTQVEYGRFVFDPKNMWVCRESSVGCRNGIGGITTINKSFTYQARGKPVRMEPYLTGFLQGRQYWGRPVDVLILPDRSVLVSDDLNGAIYRVSA